MCELRNEKNLIIGEIHDSISSLRNGEDIAAINFRKARKVDLAKVEQELGAARGAVDDIELKIRAAESKHHALIAPELNKRHKQALTALVRRLDAAAEANAEVAVAETDLRACGIAYGGSLIYPELGGVLETPSGKITTTYSRFLDRCAAFGVLVPETSPAIPQASDHGQLAMFEAARGAEYAQRALTPVIDRQRDFIGRVSDFFGRLGVQVGE